MISLAHMTFVYVVDSETLYTWPTNLIQILNSDYALFLFLNLSVSKFTFFVFGCLSLNLF